MFFAYTINAVTSPDGDRGAVTYEVTGHPHVFRTRLENFKHDLVQLAPDTRSLTEALRAARAWVVDGVLPEGVK